MSGSRQVGYGFSIVDLVGANFSNANLAGANLTGTNLSNTNLKSANLLNTNFTNANLTNADLKVCQHGRGYLHWTGTTGCLGCP